MPNEMWLGLGMILPMGASDLLADDLVPQYAKGQLSFTRDAFGVRTFRYMRNATGGATAKGELQSRAAGAAIANATSGTTTSVTKTGLAATVDAYKDRLLIVTDSAQGAGVAPEGEVGVIIGNTAEQITIDSARPFTVAIGANDDLQVYSLFDLKDAADGDLAVNCIGVSMQALTSGNWGVFQVHGNCPDVKHTAAAVVAGDPIVAGAAAVAAFGTDGQELHVGWSPNGMSADNVTLKALAFLNLFNPAGPATAP